MRRSFLKPRISLMAAAAIAAITGIGSGPAQAATINWTGGTSFWDIATNWSSNPLLPGAADDVLLGAFNTTYRSGNLTIQSFNGTGTLSVTGGTLGTTLASTSGGLNLSAGTIGGVGSLTLTGVLAWTGGTMTGAGATSAGSVTISGAGGKTLSGGRTLNAGNTTWSGNTGANNTISLASTSAFNSSGNFTDANSFDSSISGGTFNNSGSFSKQSNATTSIGTVFNNTGTVNVNAGTMLMQAGGASTGRFNIAEGARIELRNGSHTFDNITTSGLGTLQISTENVGADAAVAINGGSLNSAFLLSGSTLRGTDHVFRGPAAWTGGTINGTSTQSTTFAGTLAISGPNGKTLSGGRSVNAGNTTWSGNTGSNNGIFIAGASAFTNTGSFTDANAFDSAITVGGGGGTFNNDGIFNKQSATTTSIGTVFNSLGTVNVNAGTLLMQGGGTGSGTFNIAAGARLEYRNGNHTLNNVTTGGAGTFEISSENVGADAAVALNGGAHTTTFVLSGSVLTGTDHTFQGLATWSGGTITGAATASSTFANDLTISGPNGKTLSGGRSVSAGNTMWTGNTGNGNNAIAISGGSVFNSNGVFTDANAFNSALNVGNGGGGFSNKGTFNKPLATTTAVGTQFNNTGTVNVSAGTMLMHGGGTSTGVFDIAAGAKLEYRNGSHTLNNVTTRGAGIFEISTENVGADAVVVVNGGTHTSPFVLSGSTMAGTDATFQGPVTWTGGEIYGAAATTFGNDVAISGANLKVIVAGRTVNLNGTTTWSGNTANNNNAIRFWNGATINNNGRFDDANAFASFLEHNVGGPHNFNNKGIYNKQSNTVTTVDTFVAFNNSGILNLNAGTMSFLSGTQGPTGTVNVASGATFQHGAASTVGTLNTSGNLVLGDRTITVHADYNNANFGVGNVFNRRANVSTTGSGSRLLAAGDANQGLSGAGVSNGNSTTPSIVIGNVHVGPTTYTYQINNTGTTGPSLRGAIQNAVNGGTITDARLSGNGVLSSNWGPVAPGASISRDITINIGTAGVYAPITGQAVSIVNNFENTRSQLLTFASAAGAAAYNLASGSATPSPVVLGNQRVGGNISQVLTVSNTAPAGSFTELLKAGFGVNTGSAVNDGGTVSVAGGNSAAGAMTVGVDAASAGAKSGTVVLNYASDGSGTSGLGLTSLGSQTINVSGNVYQLAAGQLNTPALNFGTVQVGQSVSQVLSITHSATGAAGFVEDLNARFGATSGTGSNLISGSGSIANLRAGATNASAMTVNVNTAGAGSVNGAIAVDYFSAGAVNGVSNGLGELAVGSSSFGVTGTIQAIGNVINQASPLINNAVVNLGNVRVGAASPTQAVSITNVATVAPQAALNATVSAAAPITASGSFDLLAPGASNSAAIVVGLQTATAGAKSGTATVSFVSDASNVGNCAPNCQLGIGTQNVSVSGGVYRLANPTLNAPSVDFVARVGDTAPSAQVGVTNTSPDAFTERLNGAFGSVAPGFVGSGAINGLNAGAASNALALSMNTASAGSFAGSASVNFVSSGAGTTGAADAALPSQQVALGGRVYTPAIGQLSTTVVDFGIVHKGDVVAARNVAVTNAAAVAAPNDVLRGSLGGASGPFAASGSLAGVAAQATDSGSLSVALDTAGAGVFNGSAAVSFSSHNAEMVDLALTGANVALKAQVNNFAELALGKVGGDGALSGAINGYTLDFGTIVLGSTDRAAELGVFNIAIGPADLLNGSFSFAAGSGFSFAGFNPFADIAAGGSLGGFDIVFDSASLGTFSQTITVSSFGTNASGYEGTVFDTTLVLRGTVTDVAAIPEPQTYALMIGGLLAIWVARRRQQRRQAA